MGIEELLLDRAKHEGRLEGKLEGKYEGEYAKTIEIASDMKADGFPIEKIVKITKLTEKEIKEL